MKQILSSIKRRSFTFPQPRGQALIVVALVLVGLMGVAGLVIDGGNAFADRRKAQNAADTTALAGAFARIREGPTWVSAAMNMAKINGYDNNGTTNIVRIYSPPASGPYKGKIEYIQVIIVSNVKTYLAGVVGVKNITNTVTAIARTTTPRYAPILNGNAVISLAPKSDCEDHKSFWAHGEGTLDITGGGVFINSNNPTCALIQQGGGSIRIRDKSLIRIVGGASIQKPQLLTPSVSTGAIPIDYPPPFIPPDVRCKKGAAVSKDGTSMTAGSWDGDFPPAGVTRLGSGIYCLNNNFVIGDGVGLSGKNVVFKVEHGAIHFSGSARVELTPPKGGPLAGLLIYLPMDNHSRVALNAARDSIIRGTILAPGADIHIKGNDSKYGFHSQIIGYTIDLDGTSNVIIIYIKSQNYNALSAPEIQLVQ